ncbi:MAG: hypothetical protein AAFR31_19275, partial [Cyanobacteria bacterium J06627_8]
QKRIYRFLFSESKSISNNTFNYVKSNGVLSIAVHLNTLYLNMVSSDVSFLLLHRQSVYSYS